MREKEKFKIRKAELRDVETIANFNIRMAKETENKDLDPETVLRGAKAIIKDPHKGFYLVAVHHDEIIGQLMVTNEWSDWRNLYFLWIQSVYVREDYRKQGIFRSLYHFLEDIARYRKDVAGLRLYVEKHNETAIQTYESLGMYNSGYEMYEILF
ncbi:MAG: N-acetyltransferase family protein [Candidatus Omnitrophota bacterium]